MIKSVDNLAASQKQRVNIPQIIKAIYILLGQTTVFPMAESPLARPSRLPWGWNTRLLMQFLMRVESVLLLLFWFDLKHYSQCKLTFSRFRRNRLCIDIGLNIFFFSNLLYMNLTGPGIPGEGSRHTANPTGHPPSWGWSMMAPGPTSVKLPPWIYKRVFTYTIIYLVYP